MKKFNFKKDELEKIGGGKEAEVEHDIRLLHKIIEEEVLYRNLLSKFTPLIIQLVKNSLTTLITESNIILYKTSILSLCKFMCISKKFCEENLNLLFEILESSKINPSLKLNVCVSFGDLVNRFPNTLQTQINKYFNCLKSNDTQVVRHAMIVISHLFLNDMLKLTEDIVEICLLLESEDIRLRDLVNLFFFELNKKGNNVIYNVIPKALNRLNNEYKKLEYNKFQSIMKNLIKFVEKDKQTEGLIEKLFNKLKTSIDVIEWRNTTFCLSLFNYTEKSINKLNELYQGLKDKIEDKIVNENFQTIFVRLRKNSGNINKENLVEIERKFFAGEKINPNTNAKKDKNTNKKRNITNQKKVNSKRSHSTMISYSNNLKITNSNKNQINIDADESEEILEDDESSIKNNFVKRNLRSQKNNDKKPKKNYQESIEDDEEEEEYESD